MGSTRENEKNTACFNNTDHLSQQPFVFSYTTEEKIHWVRCPLVTQEKSEQVFATSANINFAKHCLIFLFVYFYPSLSLKKSYSLTSSDVIKIIAYTI